MAFASHHWPTWGTSEIVAYLTQQRDLYAYLHDQTLRLINQGYIHSEIAEMIELPPELDRAWHARGYYGSVNHNVKAIYQRYLGWYDANPAHLWQHPPQAAGTRYVQALGGVDAAVAKAREFFEQGDLRFAAELASHAVFAEPDNAAARELLATVLERAGLRRRERDLAQQLPHRRARSYGPDTIEHTEVSSAGLAPALTIIQLFDSIAIRINGPEAWNESLSIGWHFTDVHENYRMELSNGVLIHYPTVRKPGSGPDGDPDQAPAAAAPGHREARRHRHVRRPQRRATTAVAHRQPQPRLRHRYPLGPEAARAVPRFALRA